MRQWETITCIKCGKTKKESMFYMMKNGERYPMCKDCLCAHIDNRKPSTFKWILEKFDVPYIESVWVQQANKIYKRNPAKFGSNSVIGSYLRTMRMAQYADFSYKDSDYLNDDSAFSKEKMEEARDKYLDDNYEQELKTLLDKGEISKAEYDTRTMTNAKDTINDIQVPENLEELQQAAQGVKHMSIDELKFSQDIKQNYEEKIVDQLTQDDMEYLLSKWGATYTPLEWVKLETTYRKYAAEYDISVDRETTLKQICKLNLKMDTALDAEDFSGYQKLATTFDQLRKSAKFTEAQNKDESAREIDSLGELVRFVEREGGIIPQFDDPIEYPKDKVDFTIKDMQNYVNKLVRDELGLGDLIESYIEKLKKNKTESVSDIMNDSFQTKEDEKHEEEDKSFQDFLMEEIENESFKLADGDLS